MPNPSSKNRLRLAIPILFAVVLIDLVGLGILIPLIPFYVERLGASPELITLILAAYPLCQSLALPFWGAASDRWGRRPVLLLSMLGHVVAYLLIGFADSLLLLTLARMLSGATSANLATAYAYISDITGPAERAGALGKIAAAFGLGFALGPALGGLLAGSGDIAEANFLLPAVAAASLSFAAFAAIFFLLPESRPAAAPGSDRDAVRPQQARSPRDFAAVARRPIIGQLMVVGVLVLVFLSVRDAIFPLWANHQRGLSARTLGLLLAWSGLISSAIQLFLIGRLARRYGEVKLVQAAVILLMVAWIGITLSFDLWSLLLATSIGACGAAFFQTSMQSLMSQRAGEGERGLVLGVYQSSGAMARFAGQASAGTLYGQITANAPFLLGSVAMIPALIMISRVHRLLRAERAQAGGDAPGRTG